MTSTTTERVGRYQLLEPIGLGPSGSVSRAKVFGVAGFERQFAIKRFHPELTSTTALAQALSAAARAYGGLEHPRIARMSEFGVAQGTTFTAVEFVAGLDALRLNSEARLAGTTLAAGGALALVSQAARAVGYAHGRGLTHLGLAPTNVMVTSEGDVKITDFGILSATLPPRPIDVARLANRIPYLAPEQLANEATSAATDVFALGVLAYELVTGARAFRGETPQQIAQAIQAGPPAEPPLPRPIVRVLQRCLARSPFERFPDARALADALDAALRVAPVPGTRKDIGAQVKAAMERIAALHESELSGVLPLDLGTGPVPRVAPPASRAASDEPGPSVIDLLRDSPATTMQDLPKPMTTVAGLAPPPIPVPPGLAPPPIPPPPAQPAAATTLLGISTSKPPPIPSIKSPATVPPSIPPARPAPVRMSEAAPGAAPVPTLRPATVGGIPPVPPVRPRTELPAEPARPKSELPAEPARPKSELPAEPARPKSEHTVEPAGARPQPPAEPTPATSELLAKPGRARTDRPAEPAPARTDHLGEAARARTELPVERARTESPVEPPARPRAEPPARPRTEPPARPSTDLAIPTEPARPSADNEITLRGDELRAELVEPAMRPSTPPPPSAPIYELSPPSELPRDLRTTEMPPLLVERLNEATTRATSEIPSVDYLHPPATQPEISFEAPQDDDARATAFPSGTSHESSLDASAASVARSGPSSALSSGSSGAASTLSGAARSGADPELSGADVALSGATAARSGADVALSGATAARSGIDAPLSGAAAARSGIDAPLSGGAAARSGIDAPLSGADAARSGAARSGTDAARSGVDAPLSGADAALSGIDAPLSGADAARSGTGAALSGAARYGAETELSLDLATDLSPGLDAPSGPTPASTLPGIAPVAAPVSTTYPSGVHGAESAGRNVPTHPPAPAARSSRWPWVLGGTLLAGVLGVGGWLVYGLVNSPSTTTTADPSGTGAGTGSSAIAATTAPTDAAAAATVARDATAVATAPTDAGTDEPPPSSDAALSADADPVATAPVDAAAVATAPVDAAAVATAPVDAGAAATPDADATTKPEPASVDALSIKSTPPGARVFLDGADAGSTPLKLPGTPDRHTVALLLPGHELYVAQVDGRGTFSIPLKEVTPTGGPAGIKVIRCKDKERYYVFVDGKPTGQTCPTERIDTELGSHVVEVYDVITETRRKWDIDIKDTRLSHRVKVE